MNDKYESDLQRKEDSLEEKLGKRVREVWINWAKEQPNPKESWLVPWENLSEPDKEVDRRIGNAIWNDCLNDIESKIDKTLKIELGTELSNE